MNITLYGWFWLIHRDFLIFRVFSQASLIVKLNSLIYDAVEKQFDFIVIHLKTSFFSLCLQFVYVLTFKKKSVLFIYEFDLPDNSNIKSDTAKLNK